MDQSRWKVASQTKAASLVEKAEREWSKIAGERIKVEEVKG